MIESTNEERLELARAMEAYSLSIRQTLAPDSIRQPAIHKNFVLINMASSDQKELRRLSRECGMPLRQGLRTCLLDLKRRLETFASVKRKTGLNADQQWRLTLGDARN